MGFKTLVSKLKRRTPPEDPINHSGTTSGSNGKAVLSPRAPKDADINLITQVLGTDERDLWLEAFGKLPRKSQQELEKRGMNRQCSEPMIDQIKSFQIEAKRQRDRSLAKDWKVRIGNHELPVRETTVQIVHWAERIGDVAIQFAPAPGAGGVWTVAKSILQVGSLYQKLKTNTYTVSTIGGRYFRQRKKRPAFCC